MAVDALSPRGAVQPRAGMPTWYRSLLAYWVGYRKTFRASVVSSFLQPVMYLAAMGLGIGSLVDRGHGGVDGVPYLDFVAPGLLAATMLQLAANECTYPVMAGFKWIRHFHAKVASPLGVTDVALGQVAFVALRSLSVAVVYVAVMFAFGATTSPWALLAVPAAVVTALAIAAPVTAFSARQDDDNAFALMFRLGIMPMFLFSGVFFPLATLPAWARFLAEASPLTHGVALCRAMSLGRPGSPGLLVDLAYLLALIWLGAWLSLREYRARLEV